MKQNLNDTLMVLRQTLAFDYRIIALEMPTSPVFMAVALPLAPEVTGLKPRLPSGRGLSLPQAMVSAGAEAGNACDGFDIQHVFAPGDGS